MRSCQFPVTMKHILIIKQKAKKRYIIVVTSLFNDTLIFISITRFAFSYVYIKNNEIIVYLNYNTLVQSTL